MNTKHTPRVAEMTHGQILGNRKWAAWLTVAQCRSQLEHEEKVALKEAMAVTHEQECESAALALLRERS